MNVKPILDSIDDQIERLQKARQLLSSAQSGSAAIRTTRKYTPRKKRVLSAAGRAKIAAAMKKRWAAHRRQKAKAAA